MFEQATRLKLRFNYRGICSVEELWDLTLQALDQIYKGLKSRLKVVSEESLLDTKSQEDEILDLQISIVKHIFETKQVEQKERLLAKEKTEQKQKIMSIIAEKQDEGLRGMSVEELMKLVD